MNDIFTTPDGMTFKIGIDEGWRIVDDEEKLANGDEYIRRANWTIITNYDLFGMTPADFNKEYKHNPLYYFRTKRELPITTIPVGGDRKVDFEL